MSQNKKSRWNPSVPSAFLFRLHTDEASKNNLVVLYFPLDPVGAVSNRTGHLPLDPVGAVSNRTGHLPLDPVGAVSNRTGHLPDGIVVVV